MRKIALCIALAGVALADDGARYRFCSSGVIQSHSQL